VCPGGNYREDFDHVEGALKIDKMIHQLVVHATFVYSNVCYWVFT